MDFRFVAIKLFPDNGGKPSVTGFVGMCALEQIRILLEVLRSRSLQVSGHAGVKINAALTDIDRARN